MDWFKKINFSGAPVYKAIARGIADAVNHGELKPGDKLPTQRYLSGVIGCTVGTVTRSYKYAEGMGLIVSIVGSGSYIKMQNDLGFSIPDINKKDIVNLSINTPSLQSRVAFMSQALQSAGDKILYNASILDYQNNLDNKIHRAALLNWYRSAGIEAKLDNIAITSGGQHGVSLALSTIMRPNDTLLSESISYPGLSPLVDRYHLKIKTVEIDDQGVIPESLDECCRQFMPTCLFVNPRFHNPTTAIMSEERKRSIAYIAKKYKIFIIEDDVLSHHSEPSNPIYNYYPERTIYVSSVSKSLAPSLRIGTIIAHDYLINKIGSTLKNDVWMASPIMAEIVTHWINSGVAEQLVRTDQLELIRRSSYLKEIFNEGDYDYNAGSPHAWLHLPPHWSPRNFTDVMRDEGVLIKNSEDFIINNKNRINAVRISLTSPSDGILVKDALMKIASNMAQERACPLC